MKPSSIGKVFGIISYFPNNDSAYHIETRRERSRRFRELLFKLEELWPDVDIMVIAQNWQDFELPSIKNKITVYHYARLGILGARKELRKRFLASDYDCLIMLDDDGRILNADPALYIQTIDDHPNGIGVIRHRSCPLMFLAISRFIYEQIDMPDIDPEKSEGFEDDIFVAQCFARFPEYAYDFPEGCIEEHSLKYTGPGACPSTWAKENKYNWDYMRAITNARIYALENPTDIVNNMQLKSADIDVVITYVNNSDTAWVRDYIRATHTHAPTSVRFRSWGTLRYLFRGIDRYMPFVRNVVLIVSRQSQVPIWVNKKNVRVVYHEDFIPKQYLPTFNSCTIESFFWNIPDLADRIIYLNDDMFINSDMSVEDFFTDSVPHIQFLFYKKITMTLFRQQCRAGMDMITDALGVDRYLDGELVCPEHTAMPMVRDNMVKVGELCKDRIEKVASKLRTKSNVNQYIYPYYQYFTNDYVQGDVKFKYYNMCDDNIKEIMQQLSSDNYQIMCLNDSDKIKNFVKTRNLLSMCFEKKFPKKCKFEV